MPCRFALLLGALSLLLAGCENMVKKDDRLHGEAGFDVQSRDASRIRPVHHEQ